MRTLIRSIPAAALLLGLGTASLAAQQPGNGNFQWYIGGQGGAMFFKTPTQGRSGIPTFGGGKNRKGTQGKVWHVPQFSG